MGTVPPVRPLFLTRHSCRRSSPGKPGAMSLRKGGASAQHEEQAKRHRYPPAGRGCPVTDTQAATPQPVSRPQAAVAASPGGPRPEECSCKVQCRSSSSGTHNVSTSSYVIKNPSKVLTRGTCLVLACRWAGARGERGVRRSGPKSTSGPTPQPAQGRHAGYARVCSVSPSARCPRRGPPLEGVAARRAASQLWGTVQGVPGGFLGARRTRQVPGAVPRVAYRAACAAAWKERPPSPRPPHL